ncbi:MAG: signal peptidase I [Desulfobacterota bacterium]|nr:signal peptidase I [Thermodesulfobacteriota bacterium]MDW8001790.1 signal peptidase I [Deltaproteobacteria bacterium]
MNRKKSKIREYLESFIIALVIALFVRSFFIQAFKIPSSSMEPTLLVGDHLLVNRLSYVVKVPFTDKIIYEISKPKRGDVIVFRYPMDETKDFIKRVIAIEGDTIEIKNKVVYLNGEKIAEPYAIFADPIILPRNVAPRDNFGPVKVPKDSYFVLGDNRDRSLDSRFWGFVRKEHLVGKAFILYFSWNKEPKNIWGYVRWDRIGMLIR